MCGDGTKWRKRQINVEAEWGGKTCTGNKEEEKTCNAEECQGRIVFDIRIFGNYLLHLIYLLTWYYKALNKYTYISGFPLITETCPGTTSLPNFEISSPKPTNGRELECTWELKTNPGNVITLKFTKFEMYQMSQDCRYDFIQLSDGKRTNKFCLNSDVPNGLISQGNLLSIKFHSNKFVSYKGFTLTYKSVVVGK